MIVRQDGEGIIIIRQGDHAALAADIAQAWHPPGRPNERPHNSLLVAARHHDAGWRAWEDSAPNPLDHQGRPRDFMHMRLDDHLPIWRDSVEQTAQFDLYAGILVSMHAVALYEGRLATRPDPEPVRAKMRAFVKQQAAWQAGMLPLLSERPYYDERLSQGGLQADLTLLQVWDALSLMLCVPWADRRTFADVRVPGGDFCTLTVTAGGEGALALAPYPLHQDPFPLSVKGRKLTDATFEQPAALARAYASAPSVDLLFSLRAT